MEETQLGQLSLSSDLCLIYDQYPEGLIIINQQGIVVFANREARKLFGEGKDQHLVGTQFGDSVPESQWTEIETITPNGKSVVYLWKQKAVWQGQVGYSIFIHDVTDVKLAEEKLAKEHHLLQTLLDSIPDIIFVKDKEGKYLLGNKAWKKLAGLKENESPEGKSDEELYGKEIAASYRRNDLQVLESAQPLINVEELNVYANGRKEWSLINKIPLYDMQHNLVGLIGIGRDITNRKLMEERLVDERGLLQTIIDCIPDSIFVKDTQSRFVYANQTLKNLVGVRSNEDLVGKTDFEFFPKELAERYYADEQEIFTTLQPLIDREEPVLTASGELRWYWTTKIPYYNNEGKVVGLVGIGRDITERKQMEETIERERTLLRTLIDNLPDSIYVKDLQCRKILANARDLEYMGVATEADAIGKRDVDFFPPQIAQRFFEDDQRVLKTEQPLLNREEVFFDRQGQQQWLLTSKLPLYDHDGKLIGLLGIGRNITSSKLIEQVLERERSLLRLLVDSLPDCIYVKDAEGRRILANPADVRALGLNSEADVIGKTEMDLMPLAVAKQIIAEDQQVLESGVAIVEREELSWDAAGNPHWRLVSKYPLRDDQGNSVGLLGISRDITARKEAQQALQKAYDEMEKRVVERTAALEAANKELRSEIEKRVLLEEQERRRVQELEALRATITDISAELELSKLLEAIVERVVSLLNADFGELALYDEKHNDLETIICEYDGKDYRGERTPIGEGALGRVALTLKSLQFDDYSKWEGRREKYANEKPFAGLYTPLMISNKLLGVVGVGASVDRQFSQEDLHLLEMFAQQAAIAIQNAHLYAEAQRLAITDPLTGLYNRRYFMERAQNEFDRSCRYGSPLSIIMMDIDHFKKVNDTYGHLVGDKVLQRIAEICHKKIRLVDFIARYGGEEFAILLPETSQKNAQMVAQRLRKMIARTSTYVGKKRIRVTVSLGVAELTEGVTQLDTLLSHADTALYHAKTLGRNRVVLYEANTSKSSQR